MDKDLQTILDTQMKFQKAVTENIEATTKNIQTMDERIKVLHDRMDLQGKQLDTILEMMEKLRQRVHVLQEWKLQKEGV